MPILIIEHDGRRYAAALPPRLLIGRRSMNHLVIDHRAVSRMHAWIARQKDGPVYYHITDVGTRSGTRVNGQRVTARHRLAEGDVISIGPAALTFSLADGPPSGVPVVDLSAEPVVAPGEKGFRFDCPCGAPLFAGEAFAGHIGACRHCGRSLVVPRPRPAARAKQPADGARPTPARAEARLPPVEAPAAPPAVPAQSPLTLPPAARSDEAAPQALPAPPLAADAAAPPPVQPRKCGVCQSIISAFESTTDCPACGLSFHTECWEENYGCSAYGCSQVNALAPPASQDPGAPADAPADAAVDASSNGSDHPTAAPFPWEFALLAGSVFATLLGAISFGLPPLLLAGGAAGYLARRRHAVRGRRLGVVLLAIGGALLGVAAGAGISYILYFGRRPI